MQEPLLVQEGEIRAHVFELLERGCTIARIQRELDANYAPRGKRWHRTTVARIVERCRLLGPGPGLPDLSALSEIMKVILIRANQTIERYTQEVATSGGLLDLLHVVSGLAVLERAIEGRSNRTDDEIIVATLLRGMRLLGNHPRIRRPRTNLSPQIGKECEQPATPG